MASDVTRVIDRGGGVTTANEIFFAPVAVAFFAHRRRRSMMDDRLIQLASNLGRRSPRHPWPRQFKSIRTSFIFLTSFFLNRVFTGFHFVCRRFHWVLPGFTEFYLGFLGFTWFHQVIVNVGQFDVDVVWF